MKEVLIIWVLFSFTFNCFSQASGEVTYSLRLKEIERKGETHENPSRIFELVKDEITDIQVLLTFVNNKSVFKEIDNMEIDNAMKGIRNIARLSFKIKSNYYCNLSDLSIMREHEFNGINYHIISKINNIHWELIEESRLIQNYMCYKAKTTSSFIDRNGNEIHETIFAWYCPEIPVSFGPLNYIGLPGIILELEKENKIYYASSIKLNNYIKKLEEPKNGKVILEKEYKKLIEGSLNKFINSQ